MSRRARIACILSVLLATAATGVLAAPGRPVPARDGSTLHGAGVGAAKAGRDTFLLMGPTGSGAPYVGDFEDGAKAFTTPVNGWTSIDHTQPAASHWQVSTYRAVNGLQSAWCGDATIPSCDGGATDPDGGYGNNWDDMLEWRQQVTDNALSTTLGITATANIHSEPGYDGTTLRAEKFDVGFVDIEYWDGNSAGLAVSETVTYLPGEYVGPGADEVVLVWNFQSDGGWSDEDCSFPSAGAIQLDDVAITSNNGPGLDLEDFEDDADFTTTAFAIRLPTGVGDFARVWSHLEDIDPCRTNYSHQVAFIDDGLVVPGTGGSPCQTWCYGPGGYIVNTTGGLAGPANHLHNSIISPAMAWPDPTHRGALLTFGVYRHEDLSADAPGMFYQWHVGSTASGDPDGEYQWSDRSFVLYGGPDYLRQSEIVDDLLVPDRTHVRVRLSVYELGWVWGWVGNDGYPAPYFDHVRFETYPVIGPGLAAREIDLAQDGFPESGTIDMDTPGDLWVRFDMGRNISASSHLRRDWGDSLVFDCVVTRPDAELVGPPEMVYTVDTNPAFDPYRTDPTAYAGRRGCGIVTNSAGVWVPGRFYADLPDTGWLFPGDVVHYYIEASDRDTLTNVVETATLPGDLAGYGNFASTFSDTFENYSPSFIVRALPTITDLAGTQPPIMFWNDFGNLGGMNEWFSSFDQLGLVEGQDYDHYYTNGPSSGVGNGLGGAATPGQLAGYEVLLYTSGYLGVNTISNGDLNNDSGEDVQTLTAWLDSGGKGAFLTGDDLATDLQQSGLDTGAFLSDLMGVAYQAGNLRPLVHGQLAPRVRVAAGNPVFNTVSSWVAYGGCAVINTFDAVTATGSGVRAAWFADPGGLDGYPYAAATVATGVGLAGTSDVISLPYDLSFVNTDPLEGAKAAAGLAARVRILKDVISYLGMGSWPPSLSGAPEADAALAASAAPNPFNPFTTIRYTAPRAGDLSVRVFDLRGRLVRTLVSASVASGVHEVAWHGDDDRGARVASGVYFYEVRQGGEAVVAKLALVK